MTLELRSTFPLACLTMSALPFDRSAHPGDPVPMRAPRPSVSHRPLAIGAALLAVPAIVVTTAWALWSPASGRPTDVLGGIGSPDPSLASERPIIRPLPGHEVYGYVPYWEMDDGIADHLAATDLTTLALFSVTHTGDGAVDASQPGYGAITGPIGRAIRESVQSRGIRVELVYTSFGERKNRHLFDRPELQDTVIAALVEFAVAEGFDGINVDIEALPVDAVPTYGAFVGRLRDALRAADPERQVSVATQANVRGSAMALAASANGADRIFVMGYDYSVAGSDPGASAPLERLDDERDLVWSLDLYEALGVPLERTILGLPLYGMAWPVSGPELGAPRTGRGAVWVPRRNLELLDDPDLVRTHDPIESVELFARPSPDGRAWEAVYVDSPATLARKLGLADERGLAGGGLWAVGYERGQPDFTRLFAAFAAGELEGFEPGS